MRRPVTALLALILAGVWTYAAENATGRHLEDERREVQVQSRTGGQERHG